MIFNHKANINIIILFYINLGTLGKAIFSFSIKTLNLKVIILKSFHID